MLQFESSVNSEGTETRDTTDSTYERFESSVNSEGTETAFYVVLMLLCLRVV